MALSWSDGKGWRPDTVPELAFVVFAVLGVGLTLVFTGADAQIEYALTQPGSYFGLSTVQDADGEINKVVLDQEQISGISFSTKNRIGVDAVGGEIGICGGIRNDGSVYDLRVAENVNEMTFQSVQFSCVRPYNVLMHSQPGSDQLSQEDKDFNGEIRPDVACIISSELVSSPTNRVMGITCWNVPETGSSGFTEIPVYLE